MTRVYHTFPVKDNTLIKQQMLDWANRFNICCFLDNHHYSSPYHSFDCLVAAGCREVFEASPGFFSSLSGFTQIHNDWIFGHLSYEIKNRIEPCPGSRSATNASFPDYFLFVPEVVLQLHENRLTIGVINKSADVVFNEIISIIISEKTPPALLFSPRLSWETYIKTVEELLKHIKKGDCYEINFCQEFFARGEINALSVYRQLNAISPNPFSAYYKLHDKYLLCASPERYVKKEGDKLISQPIKGTASRNDNDPEMDARNMTNLYESSKDRSENVMIVDLVRNDLSKICMEGSVTVEELFGVYTFPHVHQMISTVTGKLKENADFAQVLQATFPMGSMTGAPKRKVMELIDKYENTNRGIYSGTVGYISPNKDFDFNVVIRSLVYDASAAYLSFHVGSAITSYSQPGKEYEECLLKGKAIMDLFAGESKGV